MPDQVQPTVRVAMIGGGSWGHHHLSAAKELELTGRVELVAVTTRTASSANKLAAEFGIRGYTDFGEMIDTHDLEAITVATPDHLHREIVMAGLDAGLHVLVEKPMDTEVDGCREMLVAARAADRMLVVDFHKRYDPFVGDLRDRVRSGEIGDPQYGFAFMENTVTVPTTWFPHWAANTSPFWFLGVHKYDLIRWITGRDATSVLAHGSRQKLVAMGIDTYDSIRAHIQFEGGFTAAIHTGWILPNTNDATVSQGLRLVGTDGFVEMDAKNRGLNYCLGHSGMKTPNPMSFRDVSGPRGIAGNGYFVEPIKEFFRNVAYVADGGSLSDLDGTYPSGVDGLRATQLAAAVDQSLQTGTVVPVATQTVHDI